MSNSSEYLGIRLAMIDALQHYYAAPGSFDPQRLQREIRRACADTTLLGDRADAIGDAWAGFLASRPQAVEAFLNDARVRETALGLKPIAEEMHTGVLSAIAYIGLRFKTLKPMMLHFEEIAQSHGLIDYKAGESLNGKLNEQLARQGQPTSSLHPEDQRAVPWILKLFDSPLAPVKAEDMGYHGSGNEAAVAAIVRAQPSPVVRGPA